MARVFDVRVTIAQLKGIILSDAEIQAVWEAFNQPHQTDPQAITRIFDTQTQELGVVMWNASFPITVEIQPEETEHFLEIAFWQYSNNTEDPVAIGFMRCNISDFHLEPSMVMQVPIALQGQTPHAEVHIQIAATEQTETSQPANEEGNPIEPASEQEDTGPQEQDQAAEAAAEEQRKLEADAARQAAEAAAEEQQKVEEDAARQAAEAAAEEQRKLEAEAARQAAEAAQAAAQAEAEAQRKLEADTARQVAEAQRNKEEEEQRQADAAAAAAAASAQRSVVVEQPVEQPADPVVASEPAQEAVGAAEEDPRLIAHIDAYKMQQQSNGRELADRLRESTVTVARHLLGLSPNFRVDLCTDSHTARLCAFRATHQFRLPPGLAAADRHPLVYYLDDASLGAPLATLLPDVLFRTVPLTEENVMDIGALQAMIDDDIGQNRLPALLCIQAGRSGQFFCDNSLQSVLAVCKSNCLVAHVEGPGTFLLSTDYEEANDLRGMLNNEELMVTGCLSAHSLMAQRGPNPGLELCFVRVPRPAADDRLLASLIGGPLGDTLALQRRFETDGADSLKAANQSLLDKARSLVNELSKSPYVQFVTDKTNLFTVRFRVIAPDTQATVGQLNEMNALVHQMYIQQTGQQCFQLIESTPARYFEYHLLNHDGVNAEQLVRISHYAASAFTTARKYSPTIQAAIEDIEQLVLSEHASPFALAAFRFVPAFYRALPLLGSYTDDVNNINTKLGEALQAKDAAFQTGTTDNQTFLLVVADVEGRFTLTDEYVDELKTKLNAAVTEMENDDEIMGHIQAQITRRGIEVAEQHLKEMNDASQESVVRMLPLVGGIASWWSPSNKDTVDSLSFDLRTRTLTKQIATAASVPGTPSAGSGPAPASSAEGGQP